MGRNAAESEERGTPTAKPGSAASDSRVWLKCTASGTEQNEVVDSPKNPDVQRTTRDIAETLVLIFERKNSKMYFYNNEAKTLDEFDKSNPFRISDDQLEYNYRQVNGLDASCDQGLPALPYRDYVGTREAQCRHLLIDRRTLQFTDNSGTEREVSSSVGDFTRLEIRSTERTLSGKCDLIQPLQTTERKF